MAGLSRRPGQSFNKAMQQAQQQDYEGSEAEEEGGHGVCQHDSTGIFMQAFCNLDRVIGEVHMNKTPGPPSVSSL